MRSTIDDARLGVELRDVIAGEFLGPALLLGWVRFVQRKPVTRAAAAGVVLAVGGMASVVEVWSGLAFDALGLLLGFGAAICQVSYFVLADHGSEGDDAPDPVAVIAYGLLVGAVVLTAVSRPWGMDWSVLAGPAALGEQELPAALLLGWVVLVSTVLAYLTGGDLGSHVRLVVEPGPGDAASRATVSKVIAAPVASMRRRAATARRRVATDRRRAAATIR